MTSKQHNNGQVSLSAKSSARRIRMRSAVALLVLLLAPICSGLAQSLDTKVLGKKSDAPVARPKERTGGMKACPEYGAGFYRLEGSDTCVRIGGGIRSDVGTPSGRP